MPYEGQKASLDGHSDFFRDDGVFEFLKECHYMKGLSRDESAEAVSSAIDVMPSSDLPEWLVASDGSRYESSLKMESTSVRVGFVKASRIFMKTEKWMSLVSDGMSSRSINPFSIARLSEGSDTCAWTLPGSNVRYKFARDARAGFRHRVFDLMSNDLTFGKRSYLDVAYNAFALHQNWIGHKTSIPFIKVSTCPECGERFVGGGLTFHKGDESLPCSSCGSRIYPTDCFWLHSDFNDFGKNEGVLTCVMNVLEALMLFDSLTEIADGKLKPSIAFVYDGPLAVFGKASWLSNALLHEFHRAKDRCRALNEPDLLVVGLQKEGVLMEYAKMLGADIIPGTMIPIGAEYRSKFVKQEPPKSVHFVSLAYWGQDFVYRARNGMPFVFALPFWSKERTSSSFPYNAHLPEKYPDLNRAINIIEETCCARYPSSIVPTVLAHEAASISPVTGGQALDFASAKGLEGRSV